MLCNGQRLAEPCSWLQKTTPPGTLRGLVLVACGAGAIHHDRNVDELPAGVSYAIRGSHGNYSCRLYRKKTNSLEDQEARVNTRLLDDSRSQNCDVSAVPAVIARSSLRT